LAGTYRGQKTEEENEEGKNPTTASTGQRPLSRFVHLATLVHAQTAPIRFAEWARRLSKCYVHTFGGANIAFGEDY